jgi:hypothetical protein
LDNNIPPELLRPGPSHFAAAGYAAEDAVARLYRRLGYDVRQRVMMAALEIDMLIERDGVRTPVEVTGTSGRMQIDRLRRAVVRLSSLTGLDPYGGRPILVVVGEMSPATAHWAKHQEDVDITTLAALEAAAGPDTVPVDVDEADAQHAANDERQSLERVEKRAALVFRLTEHEAGRLELSPKEFESLCMEVFVFLFDPVLLGFKAQARTTDDANRYDFICRIGAGSPFWAGIGRDFRTRAVLFECKNYQDPITADQIYSTERYLFVGALRTVCFLIARKGATDGGLRAAQGAMRESGKLILVLSSMDLVELLSVGLTREAAEDLLDEKIWQFIISLPR